MDWTCKEQAALTATELYTVLALRSEVFVVEQNCAYNDVDGRDLLPDTWHLWTCDQEGVVACLRILAPPGADADAVIGRVAVAARGRGAGLARGMLERALAEVARQWPGRSTRLSAQLYLEAFYASLGFQRMGEVYLEDDIPHLGMRRPAR
jgi:ElaA protein